MNRIEIYTPTIEAPHTRQILRYMGCRGETEERLHKMAKEAADELPLLPKACFLRLPLTTREPDVLEFGCLMVKSRDLYRNLAGCRISENVGGWRGQVPATAFQPGIWRFSAGVSGRNDTDSGCGEKDWRQSDSADDASAGQVCDSGYRDLDFCRALSGTTGKM